MFGGADVGDAGGEEGVAVVGLAVAGEEADEALCDVLVTMWMRGERDEVAYSERLRGHFEYMWM